MGEFSRRQAPVCPDAPLRLHYCRRGAAEGAVVMYVRAAKACSVPTDVDGQKGFLQMYRQNIRNVTGTVMEQKGPSLANLVEKTTFFLHKHEFLDNFLKWKCFSQSSAQNEQKTCNCK